MDALNAWYRKELELWQDEKYLWTGRGPRPAEELLEYSMAKVGQKVRLESIITGRNADPFNLPYLPDESIIKKLLQQGIRRVVVGHTPTGALPVVIRTPDKKFELISADTSYSEIQDKTPQILFIRTRAADQIDYVSLSGELPQKGAPNKRVNLLWRFGDLRPLGTTLSDGSIVVNYSEATEDKANPWITFSQGAGYSQIYSLQSNAEILALTSPLGRFRPSPLPTQARNFAILETFSPSHSDREGDFNAVREDEYIAAFETFINVLHPRLGRLYFERFSPPPFDKTLTRSAWLDQFIQSAIAHHTNRVWPNRFSADPQTSPLYIDKAEHLNRVAKHLFSQETGNEAVLDRNCHRLLIGKSHQD